MVRILSIAFLVILLMSTLSEAKTAKAPTKQKTSEPTKQQSNQPKVPYNKGIKEKVGKGGKGGGGGGYEIPTTGILVGGGNSEDLEILSCNSTTVVIQGIGAADVVTGIIFMSVGDGDVLSCPFCSPLYRKVISVTTSSSGTKTLTTAFAKMGEIFGPDLLNQTYKDVLLEPLAGCSHSSARSLKTTSTEDNSEAHDADFHRRALTGTCAQNWLTKNTDGRCTFTNCFVGKDGDPTNCFQCADRCDNGCGKAGSTVLNTDGNFPFGNFGPACCNHDYCWGSNTFSKAECDKKFYNEMISQCAPVVSRLKISLPLLRSGLLPAALPLVSPGSCHLVAGLFYHAVDRLSSDGHPSTQRSQQTYESTDSLCIAKCPTTQTSGGQGGQVLTIDLLKNSGTFPVTHDMYSIPDQLYIEYEGKRIFDTGGLVSGDASFDVPFSGQSTIIKVTINAPKSGTKWDVFVGCPVD